MLGQREVRLVGRLLDNRLGQFSFHLFVVKCRLFFLVFCCSSASFRLVNALLRSSALGEKSTVSLVGCCGTATVAVAAGVVGAVGCVGPFITISAPGVVTGAGGPIVAAPRVVMGEAMTHSTDGLSIWLI